MAQITMSFEEFEAHCELGEYQSQKAREANPPPPVLFSEPLTSEEKEALRKAEEQRAVDEDPNRLALDALDYVARGHALRSLEETIRNSTSRQLSHRHELRSPNSSSGNGLAMGMGLALGIAMG